MIGTNPILYLLIHLQWGSLCLIWLLLLGVGGVVKEKWLYIFNGFTRNFEEWRKQKNASFKATMDPSTMWMLTQQKFVCRPDNPSNNPIFFRLISSIGTSNISLNVQLSVSSFFRWYLPNQWLTNGFKWFQTEILFFSTKQKPTQQHILFCFLLFRPLRCVCVCSCFFRILNRKMCQAHSLVWWAWLDFNFTVYIRKAYEKMWRKLNPTTTITSTEISYRAERKREKKYLGWTLIDWIQYRW